MAERVIECKACGAPINFGAAVNGVVECTYCHRKHTVARSTDADAKQWLAMGEHDLDCCKFDDAYAAYKKANELDRYESEAYLGMALAEYKVQYIKDTVNNTLQPICHEISDKIFSDSKNYKAALLCASPEQREQYMLRAQEIDAIRKEFYFLQNSGLDYDCFICVKISDDNDGRTSDYKTADDLYFHLRDKGFKPFFSEREIKNRTGADYEALILYALYTSECMIVVCSNDEYLNTPWVKNEYTRFLSMINDEQKERDAITIAFSGKPIEKLPGKNGKIQGVDMNKLDAADRITGFVQTHMPEVQAKRNNAVKFKQQEEERIKSQLEELVAQHEAARLELERKLAAVQSGGAYAAHSLGGATVQSLLTRIKQFLSMRDFDNAKDYCNRVLDIEPENPAAWFLMLLVDLKLSGEDKYGELTFNSLEEVEQYKKSNAYVSARKFAGTLDEFIAFDTALNVLYDRLLTAKNNAVERERLKAIARKNCEQEIAAIAKSGFKCGMFKGEVVLKKYCGNANNIVIPECITIIGVSAFEKQKNIQSIKLHNRIKQIQSKAFSGTGITDMIVPGSVSSIESNAFSNCCKLNIVVIENGVKDIGGSAFSGCKKLSEIMIPKSIKQIEYGAFYECKSLKSVYYYGRIADWCRIRFPLKNSKSGYDSCEFASGPLQFGANLYVNDVLVTEVVVPSDVTEIQESFRGCASIKKITVHSNVKIIYSNVFCGCKITELTIPEKFKSNIKSILGKSILSGTNINYT